MNPKVSIIIPTYNTAQFLSEAIDSVLNQTYTDFELIVVDDGSTDNTVEILKRYQQNSYIHCRFETHADRGTAKNVGLEMARGRYIAFLDADDVWLPDKLEKQVAFLDEHPQIALVHGFIEMMDLSGRFLPEETSKLRRHYEQTQKRREDYTGLSIKTMLFTSTSMVRKECCDQVGCFDPQADSREDFDFYLRIAKNQYQIGFLGWNPVARYRYRGAQGHNDPAVLRAYLHVFQKHIGLLEKEGLLKNYHTAYQHFLIYSADCYYLLNELEKFRKITWRAIQFDFRCIFNFRLMRHFLISFFPSWLFVIFHWIKSIFKMAFSHGSYRY